MTRLVYPNETPFAVEVVSFSDHDVDPDYVGEIALDVGRGPGFSKRKVSLLTFL